MVQICNEAKITKDYLVKIEEIIYSFIIKNVELNLEGLNQIKIVDSIENLSSDGRFENNSIILPKNKMEEYIKNDDIDTIKATIYHELCHVDLKNKLPQLHYLYDKYKQEENYIKCFTIMVYIEYISHVASSKYESERTIKRFLESINNRIWNFNDETSRIYFIKCVPYVLGRVNNNFNYINIIKSKDFKNHMAQFKEKIERVVSNRQTDDYSKLIELENFVSKYISNN